MCMLLLSVIFVYSLNSDLKQISDSMFNGNIAYNSGGSVYIDKDTSNVHMISCIITNSYSVVAGYGLLICLQ